jgi:DNA recombination protein RmuC
MDVKFPIDNYLKLTNAEPHEQAAQRHAFIGDVREHLREMERREYLAQSDRAVDFLIIFISNEQVYGLINEWEPGLIDSCLQRKMIVCGPWTLYAVVRIIMQAWQHYHYTQTMKDIVRGIRGFLQDYKLFQDRFSDLGAALEKAVHEYDEIRTKSYKRLEQRIQRIEAYRKGQGIPDEVVEPESPALESVTPTGGRET